MDKLEAIERAAAETALDSTERVILINMIKHAGTDFVSPLSKQVLADIVGVSWNTIHVKLGDLEKAGYLTVVRRPRRNPQYIPYPYADLLIRMHGDEKGSRRLTITPDYGKYLLSVMGEKESSLTILAREAMSRGDRMGHKRIVKEVDVVLDLKDILGKFVERTAVAK